MDKKGLKWFKWDLAESKSRELMQMQSHCRWLAGIATQQSSFKQLKPQGQRL
jgi:hypothetical protein